MQEELVDLTSRHNRKAFDPFYPHHPFRPPVLFIIALPLSLLLISPSSSHRTHMWAVSFCLFLYASRRF